MTVTTEDKFFFLRDLVDRTIVAEEDPEKRAKLSRKMAIVERAAKRRKWTISHTGGQVILNSHWEQLVRDFKINQPN